MLPLNCCIVTGQSSIQRLSKYYKCSRVLLKRLYTLYSYYNEIVCFASLTKVDVDVIPIETACELLTEYFFKK